MNAYIKKGKFICKFKTAGDVKSCQRAIKKFKNRLR